MKVKSAQKINDKLYALGELVCGDVGSFSKLMDIEELRGKLRPIVISRTEPIEVGDLRYDSEFKSIGTCMNEEERLYLNSTRKFHKILVSDENFSDEHIKLLKNGELKNGDEIRVECEVDDLYTNTTCKCGEVYNLHSGLKNETIEKCAKCGGTKTFQHNYESDVLQIKLRHNSIDSHKIIATFQKIKRFKDITKEQAIEIAKLTFGVVKPEDAYEKLIKSDFEFKVFDGNYDTFQDVRDADVCVQFDFENLAEMKSFDRMFVHIYPTLDVSIGSFEFIKRSKPSKVNEGINKDGFWKHKHNYPVRKQHEVQKKFIEWKIEPINCFD